MWKTRYNEVLMEGQQGGIDSMKTTLRQDVNFRNEVVTADDLLEKEIEWIKITYNPRTFPVNLIWTTGL